MLSLLSLPSLPAGACSSDSKHAHQNKGASSVTVHFNRFILLPHTQPSHHCTPACARAPSTHRTAMCRVPPSGRTLQGSAWRLNAACAHHSQRKIYSLSPGKRLHHQRSSRHAMVPLSDTGLHPERSTKFGIFRDGALPLLRPLQPGAPHSSFGTYKYCEVRTRRTRQLNNPTHPNPAFKAATHRHKTLKSWKSACGVGPWGSSEWDTEYLRVLRYRCMRCMGVLARRLPGVLNKDGRTPGPNQAPGNTSRGSSFASHGPCSSLLHRLVRAEASVGCRGRGRSAVAQIERSICKKCRISGFCAENDGTLMR
jgi:hypothetical protein